ncbi:MAG: family 43 glycosylhydrolase [Chloroflexi bacterium]|nr:family 43 glycosylhydrolase [Chloroflexota bacterium]
MKSRLIGALAFALLASLLISASGVSAALPANLSWVKYGTGPVVNGTLCYTGEHFKPAIVVESAGNYKMYFSGRANGSDIYVATTTDGGLTWACGNGGAPVLARGTASAWDDARAVTASVVKNGASDYRMWYMGRNAAGTNSIGYATSTDGLTWTKYASNPVLTKGSPSAWDSQYVRDPSVLNVGGTYHMWYSGTARWPYFRIGHATSPDGFTWTKDAGPAMVGTAGLWDQNEVYAPYVVQNGGAYEMFYSGNNGGRWLIGHATAAGTTGPWTKDANAIISPSATGWEAGYDSTDYAAAVLDGTWKVFYSAGGSYAIGLATLTNQAQLTFRQLATSVAVSSNVTVYIDISAVTNLAGYQFTVNYDSAKVSAVGSFENDLYDTATNASIPPTWSAACAAGVCKFAVAGISPHAAVSGSGALAKIVFTGVAGGEVPLTFGSDILSDYGATPIMHSANTGFITVMNSATVSGVVQLQGRTTPTDAGTVTLYDQQGYAPPVTVAFDAATGAWSTPVLFYAGSSAFDAVASHGLYLSNLNTGVALTAGGSFPQATTTLWGGDATNDGAIGLADLTCIGGDFGAAPGTCSGQGSSDINADGLVNILDLVLAGGNYGKTSNQAW